MVQTNPGTLKISRGRLQVAKPNNLQETCVGYGFTMFTDNLWFILLHIALDCQGHWNYISVLNGVVHRCTPHIAGASMSDLSTEL